MRSSVLVLGLGALAACATTPASHAPPPVTPGFYLPPEKAAGGAWCFDPDSAALRQALKAPKHAPGDPIDSEALADDVGTLHELMRTQYSGWPELAQAQGFDVNAFFVQWKQRLEDRHGAPVSFNEGVLEPLRHLRAVVPDNHHSVWGYGAVLRNEPATEVREYQAPLDRDPTAPLSRCTIQGGHAFPDTLRVAPELTASGERHVLTVSIQGSPSKVTIQCPGETYSLSPRPSPAPRDESKEPAYSWRAAGDTAVIRIRRLGGSTEDTHVLEQLARDYPKHAQFPRILFDLRGNGGGNDGYVYDWIAQAKRGLWFSGADTTVVGALAPCSMWNPVVTMQILDGTVDTPAARTMREKLQRAWQPNVHRTRYAFRNGLIADQSAHPYAGHIDVLVDRSSASSGESAAWVLRSALGARIVGERTSGLFEYGDVRTFVLPRTGIRYNLPTKRNWYETPLESVGVPVDAYLADIGAPAEQVLSLLSGG